MRLLLITCFSLAAFPGFCQSFISEGKLWSDVAYGTEYGHPYRSSYVKFAGDSTLNDLIYKKVYRSRSEAQRGWTFEGLIRETDTGTVYYRHHSDTVDNLLYDFGVEENEGIQSVDFEDITYYIDSIRLKPFGEYMEMRKHFYISRNHRYNCETWVEGVGSLRGVLSDLSFLEMVGEGRNLVCFSENDTLKYIDNPCNTCFKKGLHPLPEPWPYMGSTWYYSERYAYSGTEFEDYCRIETVGDTVIHGTPCMILEKNKTIECNLRPRREYFHLNECNDLLFYDELVNSFQKLYDFDAKVGDAWRIFLSADLTEGITDTVIYQVDSIRQTIIEDRKLLQFFYHRDFKGENYEGPETGSYIEYIGPTDYFFPWYIKSCDANTISGLRCYQDILIGFYNSNIRDRCDYSGLWHNTRETNAERPRIYPNPSSSQLTIDFNNPVSEPYQLLIYDNLGRKVCTLEDINNGQIEVDVSQYDPGIYFYRLLNESDRIASTGKFVVE